MSWGTANNTYNGNDMDSRKADGTEDHTLVVRNREASTVGNYRSEILQTNGLRQALHVDGLTSLELKNNANPDAALALSVAGRTTLGGWSDGSTDYHPQPILTADGRTELQNVQDYSDPSHPQLALKATGRASFARHNLDDPTEIEVEGGIQLLANHSGTNFPCGSIIPERTDVNTLKINAGANGDPDTVIGHGSDIDTGNKVTIKGRTIAIGVDEVITGYRTQIAGPARTDDLTVGNLISNSDINAVRMNSRDTESPLKIGDLGTPQVIIGEAENNSTELFLHGNTQLTGTGSGPALQVNGNASVVGTLAANTLSSPDLDINGNGDVSGNLTVHGAISVQGIASSIIGDLYVGGAVETNSLVGTALDINGDGDVSGDLTVHGMMNGEGLSLYQGADADGLYVEQQSSTSSHAALYAKANAANLNGIGIHIDAPLALLATGKSKLTGEVDLNGETYHSGSIFVQDHTINMGGSGAGLVEMKCANSRLEIYVGGRLRFYVDSTGGHNA